MLHHLIAGEKKFPNLMFHRSREKSCDDEIELAANCLRIWKVPVKPRESEHRLRAQHRLTVLAISTQITYRDLLVANAKGRTPQFGFVKERDFCLPSFFRRSVFRGLKKSVEGF